MHLAAIKAAALLGNKKRKVCKWAEKHFEREER